MKKLTDYIEEVEYLLEYSFENENLLLQAFTRRSYSQENGGENNEVLEFIGDRVLDYFVIKIIADEFGFMKEQSDYYDMVMLRKKNMTKNFMLIYMMMKEV